MVTIDKHLIFYPLNFSFLRNVTKGAGVYMIKNILNNKCYIGSSSSLRRRLHTHISHLICNRHANKHLQSAFNKYGQQSFVFCILEQCDQVKDTILFLEQKYLDLKPEYNNAPNAGSNKGFRKTKEACIKTAIGLIGKPCPYRKDYQYIEKDYPIKNPNYRNKNIMKPVLQFDMQNNFIAEYKCINDAARALKRDRKCISDACSGRQLSAYGFLWKFKNEKDNSQRKERNTKWKHIIR